MNRKLASYWQGKKILITGASSGLGWALAEALAPYGVHLGLVGRRKEKLQQLVEQLTANESTNKSQFWVGTCDVQNQEQVEKMVNEFAQAAGKIDVVWVNSGVSIDSSYDGWDWDKIHNMIDTNLKGAIYTTKACLDVMVPQKSGTVVGIGSASSMRGLGRRSVYGMTKVGIEYFLESMAVELPEIQFTIIHPGYVDTPINRDNPKRVFVINQDLGAQLMIKAVAKRKHIYIYPWKIRLVYKIMRNLPHSIYLWFGRKTIDISRPPGDQS